LLSEKAVSDLPTLRPIRGHPGIEADPPSGEDEDPVVRTDGVRAVRIRVFTN
jgi:hypothetical protein